MEAAERKYDPVVTIALDSALGGQTIPGGDPDGADMVRIGHGILTAGQTPVSLAHAERERHAQGREEFLVRQRILARLLAKGYTPEQLREKRRQWGW